MKPAFRSVRSAIVPGLSPVGFAMDWVGQNNDPADLSVYTFASEPIGVASAGRRVLFGLFGRSTAVGPQTLSSTLAGNAGTPVISRDFGGVAPSNVMTLFSRDEPSGSTANIVATFSATMVRAAVNVATVSGFSGAPNTAANHGIGTTTSISLTVPTGGKGFVYAYGSNNISLAISGTGVTQNAQQALEFGLARSAILSTAGSITVTVTGGGSGDLIVVGAAYGP